MRNTLSVLLALTFAVSAFGGCKDTPGPKAAFEGWLQSIEKCESVKIKSGLTKESVDAIDKMTAQLKAFLPEDKAKDFDFFGDQLCKGFKPGTITIVSEEVTEDTAQVLVKAEGKDEKIPMKKQDGTWKIDFTALMGGGRPQAPPPGPAHAPVEKPAPEPKAEAAPEAAVKKPPESPEPAEAPTGKAAEGPAKTE